MCIVHLQLELLRVSRPYIKIKSFIYIERSLIRNWREVGYFRFKESSNDRGEPKNHFNESPPPHTHIQYVKLRYFSEFELELMFTYGMKKHMKKCSQNTMRLPFFCANFKFLTFWCWNFQVLKDFSSFISSH